MSALEWAWVWCGGWILFHIGTLWRFRDSKTLDEYPIDLSAGTPLVSVIVPARNEARNIGACVESILTSTYPNLEIIVVDDHSTDGTGEIVRRLAAKDPRVKVIDAPPLPDGWFGKQWACQSGAAVARGEYLCFTDADTRHGPELIARSIAAIRERGSAMFTVAGRQEMVTAWEKIAQPFVFAILFSRYGGLEAMSRSTVPRNKIANGQYIVFDRKTYDAVGRHESVRAHVAEDLMLAQRTTRLGLPMHMVFGREHLSTRMYTSLKEIVNGWGKNVYAAGQDSFPFGRALMPIIRPIYPAPALVALIPTALVVLLALGVIPAAFTAPVLVAQAVTLLFWLCIYTFADAGPQWGVAYPLGAALFAWILGVAAWRGDRVRWKDRAYVSRSDA